MKSLRISSNIKYLSDRGIMINRSIIEAVANKKLPQLDDLISFSNNTGISINDFLFEDIEQKNKLS